MSSKKLFSSCIECEKRHMGCHSKCPDYLADKAQIEAKKDPKGMEIANAVAGYYADRNLRISKAQANLRTHKEARKRHG